MLYIMGRSILCKLLITSIKFEYFPWNLSNSIQLLQFLVIWLLQFSVMRRRNTAGLVERRQDFPHASTYGFLQALKTIPDNAFEKVCICVPNKHLISLIDVELRECSDNSFRNIINGRVISDMETCIEINRILRTRQNLLVRLKYVPNTLNTPAMYHCRKMAIAVVQKQLTPEPDLLE